MSLKTFSQKLRRRGFDKTTYSTKDGYVRPRCSQCQAMCINGIACHEIGCPNQREAQRRQREDDE